MEKHYTDTIRNLVAEFEKDASITALILGGSLAHGFAKPDSDVDVSLVIASADYTRRQQGGQLHYNNRTLCTYNGYIDGKYVDVDFLRLVAARGSDPARYAYQDSRILFSRVDGLDKLLAAIVRYPVEQKRERTDRFAAQLVAWRWYYTEGVRQQNQYLILLALQKIILFSCRLILTANELLFPYHKWMLRVVQDAPRQPPGLAAAIARLLTDHSWPLVENYCRDILGFMNLDPDAVNAGWPTRFMKDTELKWMTGESTIDDL